jgi:hypothetical protein
LTASCAPPGTTALEVHLLSPTNNQLFIFSPTNVLLSATASSSSGSITNFEFRTNGVKLAAVTGTGTNYEYLWTNAQPGTCSISAFAANNLGFSSESKATNVILNALPYVGILFPTNRQAGFSEPTNLTLKAWASDADGSVTQVQFYCREAFLGNATTNGTNWVLSTNLAAGAYPITSMAKDNFGASSLSPIALFEVASTNPPPVVAITYPTNGARLLPCSDFLILASASGSNGIKRVDFYANGALLGTDREAPYAITASAWTPGPYTLQAQAVDTLGSQKLSAPIEVIVGEKDLTTPNGFWETTLISQGLTAPGVGASIAFQAFLSGPAGRLYAGIDPGHSTPWVYGFGWWDGDGASWAAACYYGDCTNNEITQGIRALALLGTNFVAGGSFKGKGVTNSVSYVGASSDGTTWYPLGNALEVPEDTQAQGVYACQQMDGDFFIGGTFTNTIGSSDAAYVARLSNGLWTSVGDGLTMPESPTDGFASGVRALAVVGGTLYAGGDFLTAGGSTNTHFIARLDGSNHWSPLGAGVDGPVRALAVRDNLLFVGGDFTSAGGNTNASHIAVWDGHDWQAIGRGLGRSADDPNEEPARVNTIAVHCDELFVGGSFTLARNAGEELSCAHILRAVWSGEKQAWVWTPMGSGVSHANPVSAQVRALALRPAAGHPGYELIVGGNFSGAGGLPVASSIARWVPGLSNTFAADLPSITITSPPGYTNFTADPALVVTLAAVAQSAGTNQITKGEFFVNGQSQGGAQYWPATNAWTFTNQWYNPPAGLHVITARVLDGRVPPQGRTATPVLLSVREGGPSLVSDFYDLIENSPPVALDVLSNDFGAVRIVSASQVQASGGTIRVSHDGARLIYAPNPDTCGVDIFSYSATDGTNTGSAFVTIRLHAPPVLTLDAPEDRLSTSAPVTLSLSGTAFDWDGSVSTVQLFTNGTPFGSPIPLNGATNFGAAWSVSNIGFYTLQAVAADNEGYTNASQLVTVRLTNSFTATNLLLASLDNLAYFVTDRGYGPAVTNYPLLRESLFYLLGKARSVGSNVQVSYRLDLCRPEDNPTLTAHWRPSPTSHPLRGM